MPLEIAVAQMEQSGRQFLFRRLFQPLDACGFVCLCSRSVNAAHSGEVLCVSQSCLRRMAHPGKALFPVCLCSHAEVQAASQFILRLCHAAQRRRLEQQKATLFRIRTLSRQIQQVHSQKVFRIMVVLFHCQFQQPETFCLILFHPVHAAVQMIHAQQKLRLVIALRRRAFQPFQRLFTIRFCSDAVPQTHGCDKLRIGIALFRHHPKPGIPGFLCRRISFFHLLQVTVIVLRIHDVRRICFPKSSQKLLFHQKSPFLILLFLS